MKLDPQLRSGRVRNGMSIQVRSFGSLCNAPRAPCDAPSAPSTAPSTAPAAAAEVPLTYHVELQPLPPGELCLLLPLGHALGAQGSGEAAPPRKRARAAPAAAAAPRLAQLRLRLEQGLDSTRFEWVAGTAVRAGAVGGDADAEAYAARLLNECHSLPLTVAFVMQRALP